MKKKYLILGAAFFAATSVFVAGCGNKKSKSNGDLKIISGQYIVPEEGNITQMENGKGYLSLKVKVKNSANSSAYVTGSDFGLRKSGGDKINAKDVYSGDDDFETISAKVSRGDDTTGYVVFPVTKKDKYTVSFSPTTSDNKDKTSKIKIDASDYQDNTKSAKKAAQAYINTVFLNKKDANFGKYLVNKKADGETEYKDALKETLESIFYDTDLTDDQFNKVETALKKANADRGKIELNVDSAYPNSASLTLKTTTVDLSDVLDIIENRVDDAEDNASLDADYDDVEADANNKAVDDFAEILKQAKTTTDNDGITIKLVRDNGKWRIDTNDDSFSEFVDAFASDY